MIFPETCSQAELPMCAKQDPALTEALGVRACADCVVAQLSEHAETIVDIKAENFGLHDQTTMLGALVIGLSQRLDVAEHQNALLERKLTHDEQTGVLSRYALDQELKRYFDEINEGPHDRRAGLGFVDLDGLKAANDMYDHAFGDALLIMAASVMTEIVGTFGKVYRYGGDEFVILFNRVKELRGDPQQVMNDMRDLIERKFVETYESSELYKADLAAGLSVGLVRSEVGEYPDELLNRADKAMYARKIQKKAQKTEQTTIDLRRLQPSQE